MNAKHVAVALVAGLAVVPPLSWSAENASNPSLASSPQRQARHLLLDARVIDRAENAVLAVGKVTKHPMNPLFGEDRPWEPRYDNMYPNVIYDAEEQCYKCWYTPFVMSELDENTPREKRESVKWQVSPRRFGLCYATSSDGLGWQKPDVGLVELRGSSKNNILLFDVHGADVIKDLRETDPAKRYKMFGTIGGLGPHMVWFSHDGRRWDEPVTLDLGGRSDTHNNVFWCSRRNEFIGITRVGFRPRTIGRTSSSDFVHWSKVEEVLRPIADGPQLHDFVAFPYEDVYLALVGAYDVQDDRQWIELAWSPDTIQWNRVQPGVPLIPNGLKQGDYDWGCIFAARPIVAGNEIRIYYAGCNGKFLDWRDGFLCLASLGRDRWAGYRNAGPALGVVLTQPLVFQTDVLTVTADAANGSLLVEIVNDAGGIVAESQPLHGDFSDEPVKWRADPDLRSAVGQRLRFRFKLDNATLYSFAFMQK